MANKASWESLTHEQRVKVLAETPFERIVEEYQLQDSTPDAFREVLARESRLWSPKNVGSFEHKGGAPTKDVVLGAWRDLERSEALLELIDNSIDVWFQRRRQYPLKTAAELNVYIDIDEDTQQMTYEDNAGGVSIDKLENLVVPGYSDTEPLSNTIGSYKTGGKKAVFRLATAAQIMTRYWNPAGTSDEALTVQLDESWITDPTQYEFLYARLKDKSVIEKGQTRYVLQLREEPVGGPPWFQDRNKVESIVDEIRRAYSLLMIRNPSIRIHFQDRKDPIQPVDLYSFSGTATGNVDIQPQQVVFETEMEFEGVKHLVEIELVLGCRRTTGARDGGPGIDLYGNDRMFVAYDQTMFGDLLQTGQSRRLMRGFVNIRGANVFIPWDTHKRHLNIDRDIINILTKHPLIRDVVKNWRKALLEISGAEVKKLIDAPLPKFIDAKAKDLFIPHRARVTLNAKKKRGEGLGDTVWAPKVKAAKKKTASTTVSFKVTMDEARTLAQAYGVTGDLKSRPVLSELGTEIKVDVLARAKRSR
jgi:hypothetical protein